MTETITTTEFMRAFLTRVPTDIKGSIHTKQHGRVDALGQAAALLGWTAVTLAEECLRNPSGAINTTSLFLHRLQWCSEHAPAKSAKPAAHPFCTDDCRDRQGWIEDQDHNPISRCPCRTT